MENEQVRMGRESQTFLSDSGRFVCYDPEKRRSTQRGYPSIVILCVPITNDEMVDPRWGRADRIAVATVYEDDIVTWQVINVNWSSLHDEGSPARHHARVASFLKDHKVEMVVANHVGDGMVRMLKTMDIPLCLGASGAARESILNAAI